MTRRESSREVPANRRKIVLPGGDGRWHVEGVENMSFGHEQEATAYARQLLRTVMGGAVVVLDDEGREQRTEDV